MNEKKNYVRKLTTTFNSQIKTMASFCPYFKNSDIRFIGRMGASLCKM